VARPTALRMDAFFALVRERVGTARVLAAAGCDYASYRTAYYAGLLIEEPVMLDVADLHFDRGPFGKIAVRYREAAKSPGPRLAWVPMLDGRGLILKRYYRPIAYSSKPGSTVPSIRTSTPSCHLRRSDAFPSQALYSSVRASAEAQVIRFHRAPLPRRVTYQTPALLPAFHANSSAVYRSSSVRCSPDMQRGPLHRKPPASRLEHRRRSATGCVAPRR
jgi:hypothetical protein